jgi:predicted dehydrogenase
MSEPETPTGAGQTSRREFLKLSGRAAALSALSGAMLPGAFAQADDTIKLALVGCGGRGTGAVGDALSTTGGPVKLHAMADLFDNRLAGSHQALSDAFGDRIDVPPERRFIGFDAYKKAVDSLDPGDVVILTTHAAFRPLHFEYAVERGINVFAEKSFATDAPNLRRFMAAAEKSVDKGLKVGVGFMWRHSEARQQVIQRIQDGEIGDLELLRIYRVHGPVNCEPLPAGANEVVFQIQHAGSFSWVCSGFYIDWHCHNIDVACWAKGAWPATAQGFGGRCYPEAGSQFDHYTVEYTFDDGTKLLAFSRHMTGCWETYSDYAHGTKGCAVIMDNLAQPKSRLYKGQAMSPENLTWEYGKDDPNPYQVEWQLLLDAIRNDTPHNEARRAAQAECAALMGRTATHTGQMVTWEMVQNSNFTFVKDIDNLSFDAEAPIHAGPDGIYACPQPGITVEL